MSERTGNGKDLKPGQESPVRILSDGPMVYIAEKLHQRFPNLTPNQVSVISTGAVLLGEYVIQHQNRKDQRNAAAVAAGVAIKLAGFAGDGVDGKLADIFDKEAPGKHDREKGVLVDLFMDRIQEVTTGFMRAKTARIRGDKKGERAALTAAAVATLPRLATAHRNTQGDAVREVGKDPFAFMGSRFGKAVLNTTAAVEPQIQAEIDAATSALTLYAVDERLRGDSVEKLDSVASESALKTRKAMGAIEAGAIGGVILSRTRKRSR